MSTNIGRIPYDWGQMDLFGTPKYNGDPQILTVETFDGKTWIHIGQHTDLDQNHAREVDSYWFQVKPGDRILFKAYIKASASKIPINGGGRLGLQFTNGATNMHDISTPYVVWGSEGPAVLDYVIPAGIDGCIAWLQAWGAEPETGDAWFTDGELYVNPAATIYTCQYCQQEFPTQAALDAHIQTAHQTQVNEWTITSQVDPVADEWTITVKPARLSGWV